jgi:hypothetical protein
MTIYILAGIYALGFAATAVFWGLDDPDSERPWQGLVFSALWPPCIVWALYWNIGAWWSAALSEGEG